MNLQKYVAISFSILCLSACTSNTKKKVRADERIQKISWLVGEWSGTFSTLNVYDRWYEESNLLMVGKRCFYNEHGDTLSRTTLKLMLKDTSWELNYNSVGPQEKGLIYKLVSTNFEKMVYNNATVGYPSLIVFNMVSGSSYQQIYSGTIDSLPYQEIINFKRVK